MMTAPDYAARAAAGAAYLDQHRPGWAGQINLDWLDLASECDCVLGQLSNDGYQGMRRELGLDPGDAVTLGFSLGAGRPWEDWTLLDDAWAAEITRRREPAQVTT